MTDHYRWHLSLQWVPPNPHMQPTPRAVEEHRYLRYFPGQRLTVT